MIGSPLYTSPFYNIEIVPWSDETTGSNGALNTCPLFPILVLISGGNNSFKSLLTKIVPWDNKALSSSFHQLQDL